MTELIILAALAVFVMMMLRNVLGTRTGYEGPTSQPMQNGRAENSGLEVIEGGGADVEAYANGDEDTAAALRAMIDAEPGFTPGEFLEGAKQAYEMILMAFENGDTDTLKNLLAPDVYNSFAEVIRSREEQGLTVEARFIGVREAKIFAAHYRDGAKEAEIEVRFVGEMISVVRNADHDIVEGDPAENRKQTDLWTFSRAMGSRDPNWFLSATGN